MPQVMAAAIIAAGGTGERFGRDEGKQLAELDGIPVLAHTVAAFAHAETIGTIVLVCHPERIEEYAAAVLPSAGDRPIEVVAGGSTRQASVAAGLAEIDRSWELVVVHDGARPLVMPETIDRMVLELAHDTSAQGLVIGHPAYDTLKEVEGDLVVSTPVRARFWAVQTPQVFRGDVLRAAHATATTDAPATDDSALVERMGGRVRVFEGPRDNIKVTVAEDLAVAQAVLRSREGR